MSDDIMSRTMWHGEWPVEPPKPSPGPWTVRKTLSGGPRPELVWVVLDRDSKWVAECGKPTDAEFIAAHGPPS